MSYRFIFDEVALMKQFSGNADDVERYKEAADTVLGSPDICKLIFNHLKPPTVVDPAMYADNVKPKLFPFELAFIGPDIALRDVNLRTKEYRDSSKAFKQFQG